MVVTAKRSHHHKHCRVWQVEVCDTSVCHTEIIWREDELVGDDRMEWELKRVSRFGKGVAMNEDESGENVWRRCGIAVPLHRQKTDKQTQYINNKYKKKMKKTLSTLAILFAVAQGAWAQTPSGEGWGEASTFNFQLSTSSVLGKADLGMRWAWRRSVCLPDVLLRHLSSVLSPSGKCPAGYHDIRPGMTLAELRYYHRLLL